MLAKVSRVMSASSSQVAVCTMPGSCAGVSSAQVATWIRRLICNSVGSSHDTSALGPVTVNTGSRS